MNISQSGNQNPSFGINSIKFQSNIAKEAFAKATKKIPSETMTNVLKEIKGMKPKIGPDVDTFIGTYSLGYTGNYLNVTADKEKGIQDLGTKMSIVFKSQEEVTPKSMLKAFKKLIAGIDKARMEKLDGSNIPDDLLSKVSK